jgi:hypothetical protein
MIFRYFRAVRRTLVYGWFQDTVLLSPLAPTSGEAESAWLCMLAEKDFCTKRHIQQRAVTEVRFTKQKGVKAVVFSGG